MALVWWEISPYEIESKRSLRVKVLFSSTERDNLQYSIVHMYTIYLYLTINQHNKI